MSAAELEILTVSEVAAILRVAESTVYRALEEGRLPGTKPFNRWRVIRAELLDWLSSQRPVPRARALPDPMPRAGGGGSFRAQVVELDARRRS